MNDKTMRSILEVRPVDKAKGVILGEKDGKVVALPRHSRDFNRHIAVLGASGAGKSRKFVRNLLLQTLHKGNRESVIVTDPKAELYNDLSALFRQRKYTVRVFNLTTPEHSDSWNCMEGLCGDTLTAQILTDVIISNTVDEDHKDDPFWDGNESNLLKALLLYVDSEVSRSADQKHLPAVYQMLTRYTEKPLTVLFDKFPLEHPAKAPYHLFKNSSENVRAGSINGLGVRLAALQSTAIQRVTSRSDIDLVLPGRKPCIYFIILPDQNDSMNFLGSLFFSMLFQRLVQYADRQKGGSCKVPVNIVLEELNVIGSIHQLHRRLSSVRSRNLHVSLVAQSLPQLKNRYPKDRWAEILSNCDTQIMLGCADEETAIFASNRTGVSTVEVNSNMTTRRTIAVAQVIPEYRHVEGEGHRQLMTPDEVLRLPNSEMLVFIRGQNILKLNKFDFEQHPLAEKLEPVSIYDYRPGLMNEPNPFIPESETDIQASVLPGTTRKTKASKKPVQLPDAARPKMNPEPLYKASRPPDEF